ncbi:unnamed protein product, partial [Mesorhabditis spiculigera]
MMLESRLDVLRREDDGGRAQVLPPTKLIACCVSPSNRPTKHFNLNLRFIPIASAALSSGFGFPSPQADIRVAVEGMANTLIETNRKKLQRRRSPFTEEELLSYGFTLEQLPRIVPTSFSIQGPPQ